jgi:hypothetical protein
VPVITVSQAITAIDVIPTPIRRADVRRPDGVSTAGRNA